MSQRLPPRLPLLLLLLLLLSLHPLRCDGVRGIAASQVTVMSHIAVRERDVIPDCEGV